MIYLCKNTYKDKENITNCGISLPIKSLSLGIYEEYDINFMKIYVILKSDFRIA